MSPEPEESGQNYDYETYICLFIGVGIGKISFPYNPILFLNRKREF